MYKFFNILNNKRLDVWSIGVEGALDRKPHLVIWDVVCIVRHREGSGVKRLDILNRALLGKWSW